jgi:ribonuclease Z
VLQRRWLDAPARPIGLAYPATGEEVLDHLRKASLVDRSDEHLLHRHPVHGDGPVAEIGSFRLTAALLDHTVPAVGYRLDEAERSHVLPDRLAALGVAGPLIGRLQREGVVDLDGRRVHLAEVSEVRPGLRVAFVMDTRLCEGAERLADGVDVLICEATFTSADADLAEAYGHLTAAQAARLAAGSGARLLVLGHFSSRYPDTRVLVDDAATVFPDVIVAHDLQHIALPRPHRGATLR